MIQQSVAQFTRNAQKATSIADDEKLPDRQRGMWSFLTWSFFLAQAVAAHEAFAKGHAMGEQGQDGDASGSGADDAAAQKALAAASMLGTAGFDVDPAAAAMFAAALAAGAITPQMWGAFQNDPAMFQAFIDSLVAQSDGGSAAGFIEAAELADGSHVIDAGSEAPPVDGVSGPGLGGVLPNLPTDILDDLGLIPDSVFDHIVNPLVDTVESVLGGALGTVQTLAVSTLHAVPDLLSDTIDIVQGPVNQVLASLGLGGLDETTEPLIRIVDNATDGLANTVSTLGDAVGGSGNLLFGAVKSLTGVLSTSGPYQNYDMAVSDDAGTTSSGSSDPATLETIAGAATDLIDTTLKSTLDGIFHDWNHV